MNWSPQQERIFQEFGTGRKPFVVRARAGTGKTTTILEGISHAPEQQILLAAFAKDIATVLQTKLRNPRATASTLHSGGFACIRRYWPRTRVDQDRGYTLARQAWAKIEGCFPQDAPDHPIMLIQKLAGLVKNTCPNKPEVETIIDLAYTYDVTPNEEWAEELSVEDLAAFALDACKLAQNQDGSIDFDDMIWLPVAMGMLSPRHDLIVVDEAQDMNASQLALAQGLCQGRLVVVGDDKQAIYAFRGADSTAIDRLKKELNAEEFPLTITYRCPKKVVALAQPLCPDYLVADTAPEGTIRRLDSAGMRKEVAPNDFILSRTNAPLTAHCLALLRDGKPAAIRGRDLIKSLVSLIRRQRRTTVPEMIERLHAWFDRERDKLLATKKRSAQQRVENLADQVDTICTLAEGLATVEEVEVRIHELFGEKHQGPVVMLSTIHRAKGLEAERVYLLEETLYCNGKKKDSVEEQNIHYVGITRAKDTLVLVRDRQEV